jgi:hypothetical protein
MTKMNIVDSDSFAILNDDIFKRKQAPPTTAWSETEAQRWLREQFYLPQGRDTFL